MESLWLEYGWTLFILIILEGILSADNALVLAVIAKQLPDKEKQRAINYGIIGAFMFRFAALFTISFLVNIWQVQAVGAIYLIYLSINNLLGLYFGFNQQQQTTGGTSFWKIVGKIGFADLAFAIDSILAAVALALSLPDTPLPPFGGIDSGKFIIVLIAGIAGLILIKYAADLFITLLDKWPGLEKTAYLMVGWIGVKLAVLTLAHPEVKLLPEYFPESTEWQMIFWGVILFIAAGGWIFSKKTPPRSRVR